MTVANAVYRWACRGAVRYVIVVGLLTYGVALGLALTAFLAIRSRIGLIGAEVAFALAEGAGLIFGIGMWLFIGRKVRKLENAETPSGR